MFSHGKRRNGKERVSIINKANVIKTTDGKFLNICKKIGEEYPEITTDEWYIDITTAKLIDEKRRKVTHKRLASKGVDLPFYKAIRKYGFENFEKVRP